MTERMNWSRLVALLMAEFGLTFRDTLEMPVAAAFDLLKAHKKNNEIER